MYSMVAASLEALRKIPRLSDDDWTPERQSAFAVLKQILSEAPFLSFPDFGRPLRVATDASNVGIAASLYQLEDVSGDDIVTNRRFILFAARTLGPSERNYSATKRELLAVVFALHKFHY